MRLVRVVSEVCTVNLQLQIVPVLFATRNQVIFLWAVLEVSFLTQTAIVLPTSWEGEAARQVRRIEFGNCFRITIEDVSRLTEMPHRGCSPLSRGINGLPDSERTGALQRTVADNQFLR